MGVRYVISSILPPQKHLKEELRKLRALRAKLLALRKDKTSITLSEAFQLLTEYDEPGLMLLAAEFESYNFVGDFDGVLKGLRELQQCINDALVHGTLINVRVPDPLPVRVLSDETLDNMIGLIGKLECADSESRI